MSCDIDLNQRVSWHSPHPGLMGALARIPGAARMAALELDGTETTIAEGLEKVRAAVQGHGYEVYFRRGSIGMLDNAGGLPCNCWRVIMSDLPDERDDFESK